MPTIKERMDQLRELSIKKSQEISARLKNAGFINREYYNYYPQQTNLARVDKKDYEIGDIVQIKAYASTCYEKGCGTKIDQMLAMIVGFKDNKWQVILEFINKEKIMHQDIIEPVSCSACAKGPCKEVNTYSCDVSFIKKSKGVVK